jgi:hypothetical protein
MESNVNSVSWLHGLEDYFRFKQQHQVADHCARFLKVLYSENKGHSLKNVFMEALPNNFNRDDVQHLINFYAHTANSNDNLKLKEISSTLSKIFADYKLFKTINKCYNGTIENLEICDAFSRGQVQSKIWMTKELRKINIFFDNILVIGSWYGQIVFYFDDILDDIGYKKIRLLDIDKTACQVSDTFFNYDKLAEYSVKSVVSDINETVLHKNGYELPIENFKTGATFTEKFLPNLVINSSSEHMTEDWFNRIRHKSMDSPPIVAIQSNNLFDIPEHVNCVHSIDHMKKKFPMKEILFEGELQLSGYKRVMLIGKP